MAAPLDDGYDRCPLLAAGFRLVTFSVLPVMVIGPDGKCICTKADRCLDVDKRDYSRCTLDHLRCLDHVACCRRAWQSGDQD